jgi:hypothetical protein
MTFFWLIVSKIRHESLGVKTKNDLRKDGECTLMYLTVRIDTVSEEDKKLPVLRPHQGGE